MMRFPSPFVALLLFAAGLAAAPRNVVLFIADDMGQDAGCYGNREVMTPALDQLAREGTLFRNAFCTTASCSASRSVIMTGLQNHATGSLRPRPRRASFYHLPRRAQPARNPRRKRLPHRSHWLLSPRAQSRCTSSNSISLPIRGIRSRWQMPRGRSFQTRASPSSCTSARPTPHRSGGELPGHPLKPNPFGNHVQYPEIKDVKYTEMKLTVPPHLPDLPETRAELAQYYQAISRTDAGLARLIEVLKETGQYENTVILFAADNGMAWPGAKTTIYEPGIKLPLVVRTPDQQKRACGYHRSDDSLGGLHSDDSPISPRQTRPCACVSGRLPAECGRRKRRIDHCGDGERSQSRQEKAGRRSGTVRVPTARSFRPTIEGAKPAGWDVVFASHQFHEITMYYPTRMIRTDRYKLVLNLAHQLPYPFASDLYVSATWQATLKSERTHYGKRRVNDYIFRPRYELYDLQKKIWTR